MKGWTVESKVEITITFKTPDPVGQDFGMAMWSLGKFNTVGARTYQFTGQVNSSLDPVDVVSAAEFVRDGIVDELHKVGVNIDRVDFIRVSAEVI